MIQSHMALPMRLTPEDLGLLVGGIVRQFVPDFVPAGFQEAQVVAEAGRMAQASSRRSCTASCCRSRSSARRSRST